jgi:hypothetical protein
MLIRTDISESLYTHGPFFVLIHTHDHIWNDRGWPTHVRVEACRFTQSLWIQLCVEGANMLKKGAN